MFDDKLTMDADFKFDGVSHGSAWKTKIERYMVYKAPVLNEFLEWAEAQDGEAISEAKMVAACSRKLSEEQALNVNAQIWGFLSMCLRGTAETMFKRADWNNGVEGWRRLVRQIDHGKAIRLETLRRQVQELHTRPI